jgi:hypothetical protein
LIRKSCRDCGSDADPDVLLSHGPPPYVAVEPLAIGLAGTVEDDGNADDRETVEHAQGEVLVVDGPEHLLAQALNANHRGDHDHGERHHDGLVDAGHDGRQRQRHLHVLEPLPAGRSKGIGGLEHVLVDQANAQIGQTDDRRNGVDDDGDQAGHLADAEEHDDGDEIDEARHRLHDVENGVDDALNAVRTRHSNADRYPEDDGQDGCDEGHRDRLHGVFPHAEQTDDDEHDDRAQRDLPGTAGNPDQNGNDAQDQRPWHVGHEIFGIDEKPFDRLEQQFDRFTIGSGKFAECAIHRQAYVAQGTCSQVGKLSQPFHWPTPCHFFSLVLPAHAEPEKEGAV